MPTNKKASTTKARVGGSALSKKTTLLTKRNGIIVAALAAVAGLAFVAFSFASGVSTKPYQYSANLCGLEKRTANPNGLKQLSASTKNCYNKSAEALVYRLYKGVLKRNPDAGGYAYWTQQLAGDRTSYSRVTSLFMGTSQTRTVSSNLVKNEDFVKSISVNFTGRSELNSYDKYWVGQLNNGKKSRTEVVTRYAIHKDSIAYQQSALLAYLETAPINKITYHARPGEFALPSSTPTCTSGFVLKSKNIDATLKYYRNNPIKAYWCDSSNSRQLGTVQQRTATLKCPAGFKDMPYGVTKYRGASQNPTTGQIQGSISLGKACIKPGSVWAQQSDSKAKGYIDPFTGEYKSS